jgi:hypothetical protein
MKLVFHRETMVDGRAFAAGDAAGELDPAPGVPVERLIVGLVGGRVVIQGTKRPGDQATEGSQAPPDAPGEPESPCDAG